MYYIINFNLERFRKIFKDTKIKMYNLYYFS